MARFGIVAGIPKKKKIAIKYVEAKDRKQAKKKFLGSVFHRRTEAVPLNIRKVKKGERLKVMTK